MVCRRRREVVAGSPWEKENGKGEADGCGFNWLVTVGSTEVKGLRICSEEEIVWPAGFGGFSSVSLCENQRGKRKC